MGTKVIDDITKFCLLQKNNFKLYLINKDGNYADVRNGDKSILPDEIKERQKGGEDVSKAIEEYAQELKRKEYRRILNYQIENLIFLTGAGSSYQFGEKKKGLLMSGLWDMATKKLDGKENMDAFCTKVQYADKDEKGEFKKNLETVLSLAEKAKNFIEEVLFTTDDGKSKTSWTISSTIQQIKEMIKEHCDLKQSANSEEDFPHELFLNKITKRKNSLSRIKLFTLNYDTLFEQAARRGNYTVVDGFSFSLPRTFSGRYFDYDLVVRDGSRIKNEDNFVPRVFHLYKPHGSVDWKKDSGNVVQDKAENISVEDSLMIFPQEDKYEHSYEQPFFEMMTRLQMALRAQNTTLVVIGFSFGDKHILSMIQEALEQNPSFQLIIVNFRTEGILGSDIFYNEAAVRGNLMLVNETFTDFVKAYPDVKVYDQNEEQYRLIKVAKE
jgi:hypothetical protein